MIDGWETIRYPDAELVPWQYQRQDGTTGFYIAANTPIAVVLHTMQGYISTARQWATTGTGRIASWHFSVGRDGSVLQHLNLRDGGFHAGITDAQAATNPPTWPLWKGPGINVNHSTIGIEHEGFSGEPFTEPQAAASRKLCQWLAEVLEIPLDREHFPPHADIDTVNRVTDFNTPELRELHYQYLFGEVPMTPDEVRAIVREELDARGFEANFMDFLSARTEIAEHSARLLATAWDKDVELAVLTDLIEGLRSLP